MSGCQYVVDQQHVPWKYLRSCSCHAERTGAVARPLHRGKPGLLPGVPSAFKQRQARYAKLPGTAGGQQSGLVVAPFSSASWVQRYGCHHQGPPATAADLAGQFRSQWIGETAGAAELQGSDNALERPFEPTERQQSRSVDQAEQQRKAAGTYTCRAGRPLAAAGAADQGAEQSQHRDSIGVPRRSLVPAAADAVAFWADSRQVPLSGPGSPAIPGD